MRLFAGVTEGLEKSEIPFFCTDGNTYIAQKGTTELLYSVLKTFPTSLSWKGQTWPIEMPLSIDDKKVRSTRAFYSRI